MAGSFRHCVGKDGGFAMDLLENMGDAHEACEQMFWMVLFLSGYDDDKIIAAENAYYAEARGETKKRSDTRDN